MSGQALVCQLPASLCALPLDGVVETLRPLAMEPVAGAPDFVMGLSIVRGEPIPVVDLSHVITGKPGDARRLVVVRIASRRVALAVERVVGVDAFGDARLSSLPPLLGDADNSRVTAIGRLDSELFMMLSASRLIPDGLLDDLTAARDTP